MSGETQGRPRTWVLWVVRTALALTVLQLCIAKLSTIWMGQLTGSFWWLLMALPQVSIALLAVLICWAPYSRPQALELNIGGLVVFGMLGAIVFLKWLPILIGALAILAMFLRPEPGKFMHDGPPPKVGWLRR